MKKHTFWFIICILAAASFLMLAQSMGADLSPAPLIYAVKAFLIWPILNLINNTIFSLGFAGALIVTLAAERIFPADPNQKLFSLSF